MMSQSSFFNQITEKLKTLYIADAVQLVAQHDDLPTFVKVETTNSKTLIIPFFTGNIPRAMVIGTSNLKEQTVTTYVPIPINGNARWSKNDEAKVSVLLSIHGLNTGRKKTHREKGCVDSSTYLLTTLEKYFLISDFGPSTTEHNTAVKRKAPESIYSSDVSLSVIKKKKEADTSTKTIRKLNHHANPSVITNHSPSVDDQGEPIFTRLTYTYEEGVRKEIYLESLKCLRVDGTVLEKHVQDDVLFAFNSIVSVLVTGVNLIIDPMITSYDTVDANYPIQEGIRYFPICFAHHWILAIFDFAENVVTVMDSEHYKNNNVRVSTSIQHLIYKAWTLLSDRHIRIIHYAPTQQTARQTDEYNCGIYVSYHIYRAIRDLNDDPVKFTAKSADAFRGSMKRLLRGNFHIKDEGAVDSNNTLLVPFLQAPLPLQNLVVTRPQHLLSPMYNEVESVATPDTINNLTITPLKRRNVSDEDFNNAKVSLNRKQLSPKFNPITTSTDSGQITYKTCVNHLSNDMSLICSFFMKMKTNPTTKANIAVFSPGLLTAPDVRRNNCCVWNKENNNYDLLFLPFYIGDAVAFVYYTNRYTENRNRTPAVIYTCHSPDEKKPTQSYALKNRLKSVFTKHNLPSTTFQIKTFAITKNLQLPYLCHIARNLVETSGKSNNFSTFLKQWTLQLDELKTHKGCVHHPECTCARQKSYGSSKARPLCGLYKSTDLLPNGSTIGNMDKQCEYCNALLFPSETSSICCQNGKVMVSDEELSQRTPSIMEEHKHTLMESNELWSKSMLINNNISPASHIYRQRDITSQGERTLVIQGQYHAGLCHIETRKSGQPAFAQIYFTTDCQLDEYLRQFPWQTKVTQAYALLLITILKGFNVLIQNYITCEELLNAEKQRRAASGITEEPRILMNIKDRRQDVPDGVIPESVHKGRINKPAVNNQVACIWVGDIPKAEDLASGIRVRERGGETIIPHWLANLDGLLFVLLFPQGEIGYVRNPNRYRRLAGRVKKHQNNTSSLQQEDRNLNGGDDLNIDDIEEKSSYVSRREFTLYMLSRRGQDDDLRYHRLLGWGKLTSQWIIFSWIRVEADRISHISKNLTEVRGMQQSDLFNHLDQQLQQKHIKLGALTPLPSSYVSGPKWLRRCYQDAMAVAMVHGNPDLFVTFTGNAAWKEIKDNLKGKDTWVTDPMLCARVFHEKLKQLLDDIRSGKVFGEIVALQYSIEFQKRGMPHAHILVTLKSHLNDPDLVDKIVCAELPPLPEDINDPTYDSIVQLREKVLRHMIHRPCKGKDKMACRQGCVDKAKCLKFFPKEYSDHTFVSRTGHHVYRRREGRPFNVGKKTPVLATNAYVVPYNKFLLSKYDCHVNVEVVCSITACKYIYKYIFKGPDQLILELTGNDPESENARRRLTKRNEHGEELLHLNLATEHVNARYLGHVEASYRLLGYALQGSLHTVIRLNSHLPGGKYVFFRANHLPGEPKKSQLEAYFQLIEDARNSNAPTKELLWTEVAEQFIFDEKMRTYIPRKRNHKIVSYIKFVPPKFCEQYALRLLLTKRAASGYEDLRTFNGVTHPTFTDTALAAGYMHADDEWEKCLHLVAHSAMPREVRRMFASLLLYCRVINGKELWEKFKASMRERRPQNTEYLDQFSLSHIQWILNFQGSSLAQNGMDGLLQEACVSNYDPDVEAQLNSRLWYSPNACTMNEKQQHVLTTVLEAMDKPICSNRMFFLYGKAGCGKTFTINKLLGECRQRGKRTLPVASTGIAATLLDGGRTAHSTFRIPIQLDKDSVISIDARSRYASKLRNTDLIVWDECPMQSRFAMEAVDRMLRDIAEPGKRHLPFAGITILFCGDWSQFLPVVKCTRGMDLEQETIHITLKNSPLWNNIQVLTLDQNMRVANNETTHMEWLREVGEGKRQYKDDTNINLPEDLYMDNEKELIDWIYTPEVLESSDKIAEVALLSVRNDDTLELNDRILQRLSGREYLLSSADEVPDMDQGVFGLTEQLEYINKLTPSGMPPHELRVKPGCILMLLRNIDVSSNLCNGTRLELLDVLQYENISVLKCRHINGLHKEICHIQRMALTYSDEGGFSGLAFTRVQFPVRLSFAMTTNKSQGQSFKKVGLILRTPAFAHGSTYVALSRTTSKNGLRVTLNQKPIIHNGEKIIPVRNVVYKSIL